MMQWTRASHRTSELTRATHGTSSVLASLRAPRTGPVLCLQAYARAQFDYAHTRLITHNQHTHTNTIQAHNIPEPTHTPTITPRDHTNSLSSPKGTLH